jgi:hypothetical protein
MERLSRRDLFKFLGGAALGSALTGAAKAEEEVGPENIQDQRLSRLEQRSQVLAEGLIGVAEVVDYNAEVVNANSARFDYRLTRLEGETVLPSPESSKLAKTTTEELNDRKA